MTGSLSDAAVDPPTEVFAPVAPPATDVAFGMSDVLAAVAALSPWQRMAWALGPPDLSEATPVWDAVLLGILDLDSDGAVFDEIMARFDDLPPVDGEPVPERADS